jgi:hypothetical protein
MRSSRQEITVSISVALLLKSKGIAIFRPFGKKKEVQWRLVLCGGSPGSTILAQACVM